MNTNAHAGFAPNPEFDPSVLSERIREAAEAYARMTPQERAALRGYRYTHGLTRRQVRATINQAVRSTRKAETHEDRVRMVAAMHKRMRKAAKRRAQGGSCAP